MTARQLLDRLRWWVTLPLDAYHAWYWRSVTRARRALEHECRRYGGDVRWHDRPDELRTLSSDDVR